MSQTTASSWRRRLFGGGRKVRDRAESEERDGRSVHGSAGNPSAESVACEDAAQISAAGIGASRPAPISTAQQTPAPASPPRAAALAATTTGVETSADADRTANSLPERLWDRAYDQLKEEETDLVHAYEKILSRNLDDSFISAVTESQPNAIAQNDPETRRGQMGRLIHAGLDKTAREAKVKEGAGVAIDIVLSAKDAISSAIEVVPQAALALAGFCIAMEVSSFRQ
jgi:hypothetical protein